MRNLIAFIIIIFVLIDCNNGTLSSDQKDADSTISVIDTIDHNTKPPINIDTVVRKNNDSHKRIDSVKKMNSQKLNDTSIVILPIDIAPRSGILGYSYFKEMQQNETRSITAYLSIINPASKIIDKLNKINSDVLPERRNDTASVFTENMLLYKFVTITLIDPDNDFTQKPIHNNNRQKIDTINGNSWQWEVSPKTDKTHTRLMLKVVAETPTGDENEFKSKNIPIDIAVDLNIFRSIYNWIYKNPEKALVLIIIPLVIFFGNKLFALFKRKLKPVVNP